MENDLQKIKDIFLSSDLDADDYKDNLKKITEWEEGIRSSEDFMSWRQSDVTKTILRQAKDSYRDITLQLGNNRELTEEQRKSLWAKRDAALWLISMIEKDMKSALEQIKKEIRQAIQAQ